MTIDERIKEYKVFASKTIRNENTINYYIRGLNDFFSEKLNIETIFGITDLNELKILSHRCKNDLKEWSQNIGNHMPRAAINKYIEFIKYQKVILEMDRYDSTPNEFSLNSAIKFFKIDNRINKYPIKAICSNIYKDLDLQSDYRTNGAISKLSQLLHIENIAFIDINDEIIEEINIGKLICKNIMLYGAPGVGKTHNYKKLISMIENGNNEQDIFKSITQNDNTRDEYNDIFQNIKDEKRIEFITFHQSYSYEDFIEGFRPSEEGNIELENGIFKRISTNANNNFTDSKLKGVRNISLAELISKFTNHVQEHLDDEKKFFINKTITIKSINNKGAFLLGGSVKSPQRLALDVIERDYQQFREGLIKTYEDVKPKFESQRSFHGNARYYFMFYKKMYEYEQNIDKSYINLESTEQKNFYIVIDEINRGNISKIFGELITLIEEDKRDDYEVTLPYSKEKFKIPSNLFIIATMNSTDKSIATIDIALRRRFTFLKMKPKEDLVKNPDAKILMNTLNKFIEETLGEDYMLGHSYFMKVTNTEDLEFIKEYKIKPLLEEYFYAEDDNYKEVIKLLEKDENE